MKSRNYSLIIIFSASFFFALFTALTAYIDSSFLIEFYGLSDKWVGGLYIIGSILALFGLLILPRYLIQLSVKKLTIGLLLLQALSIIGLVMTPSIIVGILSFIIYVALVSLIYLMTDIFVAHYTNEENTGRVRGAEYTVLNSAWVIAPFIAGFIANSSLGYRGVYWLGLLMIILMFFIVFFLLSDITYTNRRTMTIIQSLKHYFQKKELRDVFFSSYLLQFFYAVMVIYSPIYLHSHIGLGWDMIGIIFTIMLLAYPLFQYILGRISDLYLGEKELLITGYGIIIITTIIFAFMTTTHWWVWAVVLFIMRIGTATIEIMHESYFFKHIDDKHPDAISIYRSSYPVARIIVPIIVFIILILTASYNIIFLVLATIMLFGIIINSYLKDTK